MATATAEKAKPAKKKSILSGVTKKKVVRVRRAHLADEKYTGGEPQWDTERALAMSDADFDHHLRRSFYYYNYHFTVKDLKPDLITWLQDQKHFTVTKSDLSKVIKSRWVPITACSIIAAHGKGMPLKARALQYLETAVRDVVEKYTEYNEEDDQPVVAEDKPKVYIPTIQDRLNEKLSATIGELEGHFDDAVTNTKTTFKPYDFLVAQNVAQAQLGKLEIAFDSTRAELQAAQAREDDQLVEGYKHFKAADYKRIYAWFDELQKAVEQYRGVKKATKKARVKKSPTKEKLVAKLKYLKQDPGTKLMSINPVDVVGATELWVYNVKTRKLGKYVPGTYKTGLSVKGTTILDFDETKSVQKTLRKPEQQLAEFMKAGKVVLRTYLGGIKATETKLNGRINADVLLLRVQ